MLHLNPVAIIVSLWKAIHIWSLNVKMRGYNWATNKRQCKRSTQVSLYLVKFIFIWPHILLMLQGMQSTHFAYEFTTYEPGLGLDPLHTVTGDSLCPYIVQHTTSGILSQQFAQHCHKSTTTMPPLSAHVNENRQGVDFKDCGINVLYIRIIGI